MDEKMVHFPGNFGGMRGCVSWRKRGPIFMRRTGSSRAELEGGRGGEGEDRSMKSSGGCGDGDRDEVGRTNLRPGRK